MVKEGSGENIVELLPNHSLTSFKVLIDGVKPSTPAWAGIGDFDVVRSAKVVKADGVTISIRKRLNFWAMTKSRKWHLHAGVGLAKGQVVYDRLPPKNGCLPTQRRGKGLERVLQSMQKDILPLLVEFLHPFSS